MKNEKNLYRNHFTIGEKLFEFESPREGVLVGFAGRENLVLRHEDGSEFESYGASWMNEENLENAESL